MQTDHHPRVESSEFDCAVCGHERIVLSNERTAECPNCEESFSLVLREEFALVEWDGWIARVAVDLVEELPGAVPG